MHRTVIILLFCISIGTVTPFFSDSFKWPPWNSSIFTDLINTITNDVCSYFAKHPDRAVIALHNINETLQKTNETAQIFTSTIAYINAPANQMKFIGGTSTCPTFFNELKDALVTDWKNRNSGVNNAENQALNTLNTIHDILKSLIN